MGFNGVLKVTTKKYGCEGTNRQRVPLRSLSSGRALTCISSSRGSQKHIEERTQQAPTQSHPLLLIPQAA